MIKSSASTTSEQFVGVKRVRELIRRQCQEKFGPPTHAQEQKLNSIERFDRLERLGVRLIKSKSWDELLKGEPDFEEPEAADLMCEAILEVGRLKFGLPKPAHVKKLKTIKDTKRLAQLGVCLHLVRSWNELLEVR